MRGNFMHLLAGFVALPIESGAVLDLYDENGSRVGSAHVSQGGANQVVHYSFDKGTVPVGFIFDDSAPPVSVAAWFSSKVDAQLRYYRIAELKDPLGGSFRSLAS